MTTTPQEMPEEIFGLRDTRSQQLLKDRHGDILTYSSKIQAENECEDGEEIYLLGGSSLIASEREKWIREYDSIDSHLAGAAYVERDKAARETAQLKNMFGTENLHLRGRIDDLETYLKIKTDAVIQLEASHARLLEDLRHLVKKYKPEPDAAVTPEWGIAMSLVGGIEQAIAAAEAQDTKNETT